MQIQCPSALIARALGETGFAAFHAERGAAENYTLTPVQSEAILRMTLGQLVNLEQEKLADEYRKLLDEIAEYLRILSDEQNIRDIIRADLAELKKKHADPRRTEISGEEIGSIEMEDLIAEENDGRLDQPQRLHQAHSGERLPRPAPRRQGHRPGRRPKKKTRSPTCSSPARTITCCSSPTAARSTGRRSTTCRSSAARAAAGRSSTC